MDRESQWYLNCDFPDGFTIDIATMIISRPAPVVRYTCDTCSHYRKEMLNLRKTRVHILPCEHCQRLSHVLAVRAIMEGREPDE